MKKQFEKATLLLVMAAIACGCGVRGDPLPPGTPAEIGRGRPSYKRATEGFKFSEVPEYRAKDPEIEKEENSEGDDD
jgi:hypothetical protein